MTQSKLKLDSKNHCVNLNFVAYDDSTITPKKTDHLSSFPKNLISRLNDISSPVANKLKFWNKGNFEVNQSDPSLRVIYLGNLGMQHWSKDESCLDKPLGTLWNNYLANIKTEVVMHLTICNSGLKALTRQHGLTQYWSNRLVHCCSQKDFPKIFCWIYRHEGKKMRHELRCHAVLCPTAEKASKLAVMLNQRLTRALQEFKREKRSRGASLTHDLSLTRGAYPRTVPLRRQILTKGSAHFRPPLERSKSAPKLTSIREEEPENQGHRELQGNGYDLESKDTLLGDTGVTARGSYTCDKFPRASDETYHFRSQLQIIDAIETPNISSDQGDHLSAIEKTGSDKSDFITEANNNADIDCSCLESLSINQRISDKKQCDIMLSLSRIVIK